MELGFELFPITVPIMTFNWQTIEKPPQEILSPGELIDNLYFLHYSQSGLQNIIMALRQREWIPWREFLLYWQAQRCNQDPGTLRCPRHLEHHWRQIGVIPYPHQLAALDKVVNRMRGRAILADEVGLGKTIEAGMILKEYILRGLVRKALILTPATLCFQWYHELKEKFLLNPWLQRNKTDWEAFDLLIASLDTAKRSPHREIILQQDYDLLIVDEAHKLKNERSQNWQLVNGIKKKYCLLLTATPVQNDLKELFNLINLLRPGQLGTYRQFKKNYVADKRKPKNTTQLRPLLDQIMIRNRRGSQGIKLPKRIVENYVVELTPPERELYDQVTDYVRNEFRRRLQWGQNPLPLITLQREVCSSAYAAACTLEKLKGDEEERNRLIELAAQVGKGSKLQLLEELAGRIDEKIIIFTEYRATQIYLRHHLEQAGFTTVGFDGGLSPGRKEWIRNLFQNHAQIMVSTECGGEGINFQFCHHLVNYDLPWNPMRLEQRIGRLHRLGQRHDVKIYNLVTAGTIEEHILYLLHEKIGMFEMVIGELDTIVANLATKKSLEGNLAEILLLSESKAQVRQRLDELAFQMRQAFSQIQREDPIELY
ncbi:MAG: DEAD/DEAH box helicase [Limnochordia bacterium]|jgi:SNF2 family DNA or RNA helicase